MGDTNYENFKMPKNIRQIGNINDLSRVIYVEDYVMSYMKQLSKKEQSEYKVAILLGKYIYNNKDGKSIFIKGAIEMKDVNIIDGDIFTDGLWTKAYEEIKKYFSDVEIVGWAIVGLGTMLDVEEQIKNLHINNFHGPDKLLFKLDTMENEEGFCVFESNQFIKQSGYYIYYEKNEEMQNYMIAYNQEEKTHEEYKDVTTKKIRNIIDEKENQKKAKNDKNMVHLTYAAGTLMAVIILAVASTMLRNYHQMKNLETALESLSNNIKATSETSGELEISVDSPKVLDESEDPSNDKDVNNQETVDVETIPGNVGHSDETMPKDNDTHEEETIEEETIEEETVEEEISTEPETESAQVPEETEANTVETKYYIVSPGDSLVSICRNLYNDESQAKIEEIKILNKIDNQDKIYAGQQLIIP
ncbi:MAG TPA: LysM peptidoglycan-binding domain-containing protein [Clostridiales bacterium]|nr:LysM peptidoglycan-binding domain-containing protein [Clostridiales bacterium]